MDQRDCKKRSLSCIWDILWPPSHIICARKVSTLSGEIFSSTLWLNQLLSGVPGGEMLGSSPFQLRLSYICSFQASSLCLRSILRLQKIDKAQESKISTPKKYSVISSFDMKCLPEFRVFEKTLKNHATPFDKANFEDHWVNNLILKMNTHTALN